MNAPTDRLDRRPWAELPSLVLADDGADVRGWEVMDHDRPIGTVVDLLVDVDRLTADLLLVSAHAPSAERPAGEMLVPLAGLTRNDATRRLVPGEGMVAIKLRYRSTVPLMAWAAIAVAVLVALAWALGAFGV